MEKNKPTADPKRVSRSAIISAVLAMDKEDQEELIEDLLAATSPEYIESVAEARAEYKRGEVYTHEEVFQA